MTFRKQYRGDQDLEVKTEPRLLGMRDRGIQLQRLKLSPPARVYRLIRPAGQQRRGSHRNSCLSSGRQRQSRISWQQVVDFLDAKAASQLNSDDFANVGQALVMHNSLNILLAHQSWAETSFSGAHLQNLSGGRTCVASSQVVLMPEYSERISELK